MKKSRYTLFVCLGIFLLVSSVGALASQSDCSGKAAVGKAGPAASAPQVAEEPAMAAIPPPEKDKEAGENTRQLKAAPLNDAPAMAAIPGDHEQKQQGD